MAEQGVPPEGEHRDSADRPPPLPATRNRWEEVAADLDQSVSDLLASLQRSHTEFDHRRMVDTFMTISLGAEMLRAVSRGDTGSAAETVDAMWSYFKNVLDDDPDGPDDPGGAEDGENPGQDS